MIAFRLRDGRVDLGGERIERIKLDTLGVVISGTEPGELVLVGTLDAEPGRMS
jgi:hypothetical protein